jgi:hypothetical protein
MSVLGRLQRFDNGAADGRNRRNPVTLMRHGEGPLTTALAEPRAPTWLGAGKGDGRGAEGVGPSHCE